jgi:molecular chaperone DnaJ
LADRDYYEILGIDREADLAAVKRAYRRAAVKFHPDRNPGDPLAEENFKQAAEAYSVLSDPQKRQLYDQFGTAGFGAGQGFRGFDQDIFGDFSDILGDLFGLGSVFGGAGRTRRRGSPGRDLRYDLEIEFEEAVRGLETHIQVPRFESCESCSGSGAEENGVQVCPQCGGRGQVAFQQGFFTIARTCGRCSGRGKQITDPCKQCRGEGRVQRERTLTARIPPGVDEGMRLRMAGEGEQGSGGGRPGDLYVVLHVREHPVFTRDGDDIHCRITLSFPQVALGTHVEVPTVDGKEALDIPAGTQSGERFRLKGRGVPRINASGRGEQYVTVQVRTPKRLTQEQRRLVERLAELGGDESGERGLFDRVKDIFN